MRSDSSSSSGGSLGGGDAHADRLLQLADLAQLAQAAECVEVGAVIAGVGDAVDPVRSEESCDRRVLASPAGRAQLEDLASPVRLQAMATSLRGDRVGVGLGRPLIGGAAPVKRLDRSLVLRAQAGRGELLRVELGHELGRAALASLQRGVQPGCLLARQQQLETVVAGVGDPVDADQAPRLLGTAAGDAADHAVVPAQLDQRGPGGLGHRRSLGPLYDRRQGAVDIGEDRGPRGFGPQRLQRLPDGGVPCRRFARHGI